MSSKMRLEREDLYLLLYDYVMNFRGTYPFVVFENGETSYFPGELFKHFMRQMLRINHKTCGAEMDMIQIMREDSAKNIVKEAKRLHPILKKRNSCDDKFLYIKKEQARIRSACLQFHREKMAEASANLSDVKSGKVAAEYSNIQEFTQMTGKRFRMTKDQKERGLDREAAFQETYGD